jgi:thioredoxin:protein disulfide reductase
MQARSRVAHSHRMNRLLALLAACLAGTALAAPSDEPLDPNVAFRPSAALVFAQSTAGGGAERHGIDIEYRIAPGYYLYRNRLRFQVSPATVLVGAPELPPGLEVDDPFLGKSAIFREKVTIHLPFAASSVPPGRYVVKIVAQGCAEDRICYSPFPQEVALTIPAGYRTSEAPPAPGGLPR